MRSSGGRRGDPDPDDLEEIPDQAEWCVRAEITRWVDDDPQPGIVETRLTDRFGKHWFFISKYYDVSNLELSSSSTYPLLGYIRCVVIARKHDEAGREIVEIDTDDHPRGMETVDEHSRFEISADQLRPANDWQRVQLVRLHRLD